MVAEQLGMSGSYVLVKGVNFSFIPNQEVVESTTNTTAERVVAYLMSIDKQAGGKVEFPK